VCQAEGFPVAGAERAVLTYLVCGLVGFLRLLLGSLGQRCRREPVEDQSVHVLGSLPMEEVAGPGDQFEAVLAGEILRLVLHEFGARIRAAAECEPAEFELRIPIGARRAGRVVELAAAEGLRLVGWLNEHESLTTPASASPRAQRCRPPSQRNPEPEAPRRKTRC